MPGARGNYGAAEREQARFEHRAGRREVIGESVDHAVAGAEAAGEKSPRAAPPVRSASFGVVDRTGREEQLGELLYRRGVKAAKRRHLLLQRAEIRLARHGQR